MKKLFWSLALAAAAAAPATSHAREPEHPFNTGALGLTGGVNVTNAYYFRGFLQERHGVIVQPTAEIDIFLFETEEMAVEAFLGTWNSFHSKHTRSAGINDSWYESRIYGGLTFGVNVFELDVAYIAYASPNHAFEAVQELGAVLRVDDGPLMERLGVPFELNPYVGAYFQTRGETGAYLELGAEPRFEVPETPFELSVPVIAGFSLDDFYIDADGSDRFFGYFSLGLYGYMPLPMPAGYGDWSLRAGVSYLYLSAPSLRAANRGDRHEFIGTVGMVFRY